MKAAINKRRSIVYKQHDHGKKQRKTTQVKKAKATHRPQAVAGLL